MSNTNKKDFKKTIVTSTALGVVGRVIRQGFMMLFIFVMSRQLSSQSVGIYAVAKSLFDSSKPLGTWGFQLAIAKYVSEVHALGDEKEANRIIAVILLFITTLSSIISISLFFARDLLATKFLGEPNASTYIGMFALAILPATISIALWYICRAYHSMFKFFPDVRK